jgi:hypothetical protein
MWRSSNTAFRVVPHHTCFKRSNLSKSSFQKIDNQIVRKRTRKKYSELPTSYTLEDGSVAPALEPLVNDSFPAPTNSGYLFSQKYTLININLTLGRLLGTTEHMNTDVQPTINRDNPCQKSSGNNPDPSSASGEICKRYGCHSLASPY